MSGNIFFGVLRMFLKMRVLHPIFIIVIFTMGIISRGQGSDAYDPEASITGLYTGPYFDPLATRNLTAHLGDRAELPCTVRQLGDKSVSWVRMRDADILTVDRYTFVGDERFEAHYCVPVETWNLVINYVQERDAGDYECQVSTEPKMSQFFNLRVVVPQVNIEPPGDRHVKSGSRVRIDCHITEVVKIPDYIFWYHDDIRVLDRANENLEFTVERTGEESIKASLHIERVRKEQSGNYTCSPSNLHAAHTLLHVLNEEHPAAMQDGRNSTLPQLHSQGLMVVLLCLLICIYFDLHDRTNTQGPPPNTKGNIKSINIQTDPYVNLEIASANTAVITKPELSVSSSYMEAKSGAIAHKLVRELLKPLESVIVIERQKEEYQKLGHGGCCDTISSIDPKDGEVFYLHFPSIYWQELSRKHFCKQNARLNSLREGNTFLS